MRGDKSVQSPPFLRGISETWVQEPSKSPNNQGDARGIETRLQATFIMRFSRLLTPIQEKLPQRYKLNAQELVWQLIIGDRRSAIIIIMPVSSPKIGD
ncbi:MAG TPA: hypothetical protein DGO89_21375 [Microcoleaceae bacterium UBA9251]|nr:hypothetical protein [Microcoleaceae cyanobacterium UBA9251]